MKTIENFKKENELTNEMMEELKSCYESPYNEHADLSFVNWLYAIKEVRKRVTDPVAQIGIKDAQKINKTLVEDGYLKFHSSIKDAELSEYVWLNSNVSKSVFSNGITVYTNHSNKIVNSPIGKLGAYEYKVG